MHEAGRSKSIKNILAWSNASDALILGGGSTAIWGIIASIRNKKQGLTILKDFIGIKQPSVYYGYTVLILFFTAIVFGGIEEIGWRYTWQPILEKYIPFEAACIATFISWGAVLFWAHCIGKVKACGFVSVIIVC